MKPRGERTAEIGEHLRNELSLRGYDVFHDHGPASDNVGRIVSWFGKESAPTRDTELAQLDIAVIERSSGRALTLVEIEDTNDTPKTFLAAVFGALFGEHITFHGNDLKIGPWTTLIVVGQGKDSQQKQNDYLSTKVLACQRALTTDDKWFGEIVIESFTEASQPEPRLKQLIERAVQRGAAAK